MMAADKIVPLLAPGRNGKGLHFNHPRVPISIKLPYKLQLGTQIYVHGAMAGQRMTLNLTKGGTDANIFFHFNPRIDDGVIVRNSFHDGHWGEEEKDGGNPLEVAEHFLLVITAIPAGYKMEINGSVFSTFGYRKSMPLIEITHLSLDGEVVLKGIHIPFSCIPVPLILPVPEKTFLGHMIVIKGKAHGNADRFAVNLQRGTEEDADITYHFNPRFKDNMVVSNNRVNGSWGSEERSSGLPIDPGDSFTLCIVASKDGYLPIIDGNHLPLFPHRSGTSAACTALVEGDIKIKNVTLDCPWFRPSPYFSDSDFKTLEDMSTQVFHPGNPVSMELTKFQSGKSIYLSGKIKKDATRFQLNLQCGESEDSDIALHLNPRWDSDGGPVLVVNSFVGGDWGEEVRGPNNIAPGSEVVIHIMCNNDNYRVMVDDCVVIDSFPHRLDCGRVTHVKIEGCIKVSRLLVL